MKFRKLNTQEVTIVCDALKEIVTAFSSEEEGKSRIWDRIPKEYMAIPDYLGVKVERTPKGRFKAEVRVRRVSELPDYAIEGFTDVFLDGYSAVGFSKDRVGAIKRAFINLISVPCCKKAL